MRAPLRHPNLVDRRPALPAGQIRPPINVKVILRSSLFAIGLAIPTDARAFMLDARQQRLAYRLMQPRGVVLSQVIYGRRRVNAGAEQGLVGVDIAHARYKLLRHQQRT